MTEKETIVQYAKTVHKYSLKLKELIKLRDEIIELEKQMPQHLKNSLKGGYASTLLDFPKGGVEAIS